MKIWPKFQFRITHLLVIFGLTAGALWVFTQAGIENCEVVIVDLGVSRDTTKSGTTLIWDNVRYRFCQPEHLTDYDVVLFLKPDVTFDGSWEPDDRIRFRFRHTNSWGLQVDSPDEIVLRKLGLSPENIEERITEKNWQTQGF